MQYQNENLGPGNFGYFFVVLSFVAVLLALTAYIIYTRNESKSGWRALARTSFLIHGLSVAGIFSTLFYLIYTHQFQYNYVWTHSSRDLPWYYMISCFWEGQEGSFLLWTIWDVFLGIALILTAKRWEGPVMVVMCLAQVMLASMLLGIDQLGIFGHYMHIPRIGSNPFILLRKAMPDIPLFTKANYVDLIADGRGLNALLQNYWMVIHPPVLFLGFASTIVPFAFAMAGLWKKQYGDWVRPALPWAVLNGMVLGTGILMGGAWAYEALSFGGFWAWDPVENASLVPWLIVIGGLHTMFIFRARKTALLTSFVLVTIAYLLILYSTFLTRSGILGDSSVHSFTDLGLSGQLLLFIFLFLIVAAVSFIIRWKTIPRAEKEESAFSREFWLFIGALILSLSALHIISITSLPVFNKVASGLNTLLHTSFKTNIAKPADPIGVYHSLQIPFAVMVALLTAIGQYLKYYKTLPAMFWKRAAISLLIALLLSIPILWQLKFNDYRYSLLLISSLYAAIANLDILLSYLRQKNFKLSGASVAHIGLSMILMGALIANAKKATISYNTEGFNLTDAPAHEQFENKALFKGLPVMMGDYRVVFTGDSTEKNHIYYTINYDRLGENNKVTEHFTLHPYILYDKQRQQFTTTSPSTRHYLTKDIFTHITAAANTNLPEFQLKYDTSFTFHVIKGDTFHLAEFKFQVSGFNHAADSSLGTTRHTLTLVIDGTDSSKAHFQAKPQFILNGDEIEHKDDELHDFGLKFRFNMVDPSTGRHELIVLKSKRPARQFITLKAIIFPMINLLWLGAVVMVVGFFIALVRRIREYKA